MAKKDGGMTTLSIDELRENERFDKFLLKRHSAVVRVGMEEVLKASLHGNMVQCERVLTDVENTVDFSKVYPDVKERWERMKKEVDLSRRG